MNRPADPRSVRSTSLSRPLPTLAISLAVLASFALASPPPAHAQGPAQAPPNTADHQPRPFAPIAPMCPYEGRRIIAIDTEQAIPFDLSQPRWDAWSSYLPESNALALWNGRGGLWRVPVLGVGGVAGLGAEGVAAGDR